MSPHTSPVPRDVETELRRVVERWHQLPLDRASSHVGAVRALAQRLADEAHRPEVAGEPGRRVPGTPATSFVDPEVADEPGRRVPGTPATPPGEPGPGALGPGESPQLPDLGPAVLMDQLRVTVYDACCAGHAAGLADDLARLRRELG